MRKLAAGGLAALITAAGAAAALASATAPNVTVTAAVSPNRAGTPAHPQGVHLSTTFRWQDLGSAAQPVVQRFKILFPKGSLYNGAKYPTCSVSRLNADSPSGCPSGSIMGSGTGTAYADTTVTHPQITVVNGGASRVYFYTVLNNPARVQQAVIGQITHTSGAYAYELQITVPQDLQVVAGVPIALTSLHVTAGRGSWLATTSCGHGGRWPFGVTTSYSTGASAGYTASIRCH